MFEQLLPAMEKSILEAFNSVPIVFEGIEHSLEKTTLEPIISLHNSHELLYLRNGEVEFLIEGKPLVLAKGSVLIIRPNVKHGIRILSNHADLIGLYFGFSRDLKEIRQFWIHQLEKEHLPLRSGNMYDFSPNTPFSSNPSSFPRVQTGPSVQTSLAQVSTESLEKFIHFAKGDEKEDSIVSHYLLVHGKSRKIIGTLVEKIVQESKTQLFAKPLMMQLMTMELLIQISRALREEWEESLRVKHGKARELVLIARDYLVENYHLGICVADAASYVFLSQGYFTRAFREELGISPLAFLMQVRVNEACKLLTKPDIKVSGIASQVGFSSPQRFNVAFRKHLGMTPMEYRQKLTDKKEGPE